MYEMVCTRTYIAYAVGTVSRFLTNPRKKHQEAIKWILKYLKGTQKVCLCYGGDNLVLEGYTDAYMKGNLDGRKSTLLLKGKLCCGNQNCRSALLYL